MSGEPAVGIREAEPADLTSISAFMLAQGQARCSETYLRHWYFQNPVRGGSLVLGEREGRIVGMATTTAHRFVRLGEQRLVAMPQKVLTHASLRGQGVFGKLYRQCEASSSRRGTDFLLTVTNADSTDIFLKKFGYTRLPSPRVAVMTSLPGKVEAHALESTEEPVGIAARGTAWRMSKEVSHLRWRYLEHPLGEYTIVRCSAGRDALGDLFLRRTRKRGLPLLLLMDMSAANEAVLPALMRVARRIAWKQGCLALLCLVEGRFNAALAANAPVLRPSSGFNFLVKGKDPAATAELARQCFEISFGDLDFF